MTIAKIIVVILMSLIAIWQFTVLVYAVRTRAKKLPLQIALRGAVIIAALWGVYLVVT